MIIELVDGVIDLVKSGLPYLNKVEDLPGRDVLREQFDALLAAAPCVYAVYEGGRFKPASATAHRQPGNPAVILAVCARNLRDRTGRAALRGDGYNRGAYEILEDLNGALLGKIPAAGFGALNLGAHGLFALRAGKVMYLATFHAGYQLSP